MPDAEWCQKLRVQTGVVLPTVTAQSSDCQNSRNGIEHTKSSLAPNLNLTRQS